MDRIAYILPGFRESTKEAHYQRIGCAFQSQNIEPVYFDILWKHRTMTDYIQELRETYSKKIPEEAYLLGFSFGAMVSFISSIHLCPRAQILCSLSPFFREDLPFLKIKWKNNVGKRRIEDFRNYSFHDLGKRIYCENFLVVGEREDPLCLNRAREACLTLKKSKLIFVEGTGHDLSHKKYLRTIEEIISQLK